jgi:hypothetical protein
MGTSAFEILVVPVFWATFGGYFAGAALLFLMKAVAALLGHPGRPAQYPKTPARAMISRPRAARSLPARSSRSFASDRR